MGMVETRLAASETRQASSLQQELVRSEFGHYSKTSKGREETEVLDAQA
jgi:hypothetical protein